MTNVALVRAARAGIRGTTSAIQALPTSTVQALAAGSAGLGAGLFLGGPPRLVAAAGMAPAVVLGAAALSRTLPRVAPDAGDSGPIQTADESRFDDDGGPVDAPRAR